MNCQDCEVSIVHILMEVFVYRPQLDANYQTWSLRYCLAYLLIACHTNWGAWLGVGLTVPYKMPLHCWPWNSSTFLPSTPLPFLCLPPQSGSHFGKILYWPSANVAATEPSWMPPWGKVFALPGARAVLVVCPTGASTKKQSGLWFGWGI